MTVQDRGLFSVVTPKRPSSAAPLTGYSTLSEKTNSPSSTIARDENDFIGQSPAMMAVYELIARMGVSRAPVFITGESGTGKEVTAQALHRRSGRSGRMVALNCSAIPRDLIESEIFGHAKGAFTGAHEDRTGAAELAHGGTLFLDEIGEMDLALQAKLLRFIQTGEVRRLGDTKVRHVDVRFICATNRRIEDEVAQGRFREDLYYRLCVLPIQLPPLRMRGEDAVLLARHFLNQFSREEGRSFTRFDAAAESLIQRFDWPGNVRQLQNVIRRLVVMNEGEVASAAMLPLALAHGSVLQSFEKDAPRSTVLPFWMREKQIIEDALSCFGGNMAKAAAALELNPSTLYRKREQWARQSLAAALARFPIRLDQSDRQDFAPDQPVEHILVAQVRST